MDSTRSLDYTQRLEAARKPLWRRFIDVQAPYRWNLRRLQPGFVLEVGAGVGRCLNHLGGNGVGVDHNPTSVQSMRRQGLHAYTPEEFRQSDFARAGVFDSLLFAHVLEHLPADQAPRLIAEYLPFLKTRGRVVVITPQARGFASDPTHVHYVDAAQSAEWLRDLGCVVEQHYSFPFPAFAGRFFKHNEFVVVARR